MRGSNDSIKYFLGHPEAILDSSLHKAMMNAADRIRWLVIDEAHCMKQWAAFRPLYDDLGRLRALFPNARVLALTATATSSARDEIATKLTLNVSETCMCYVCMIKVKCQFCVLNKTSLEEINDVLL